MKEHLLDELKQTFVTYMKRVTDSESKIKNEVRTILSDEGESVDRLEVITSATNRLQSEIAHKGATTSEDERRRYERVRDALTDKLAHARYDMADELRACEWTDGIIRGRNGLTKQLASYFEMVYDVGEVAGFDENYIERVSKMFDVALRDSKVRAIGKDEAFTNQYLAELRLTLSYHDVHFIKNALSYGTEDEVYATKIIEDYKQYKNRKDD